MILAAASAVGAVVVLDIAILTPELSKYGGVSLPMSSLFAPLCLIAAALTWYAGVSVERVPLGALRGSVAAGPSSGLRRPRTTGTPAAAGGGATCATTTWMTTGGTATRSGADPTRPVISTPMTMAARASTAAAGCTATSRPRARAAAVVGEDTGYGYQDEDYHGNGAGDYDSREMDAAVRAGRLRHRQPERGRGRAGRRPEPGRGPRRRAGPGPGGGAPAAVRAAPGRRPAGKSCSARSPSTR